jgi:hypothetical protein
MYNIEKEELKKLVLIDKMEPLKFLDRRKK